MLARSRQLVVMFRPPDSRPSASLGCAAGSTIWKRDDAGGGRARCVGVPALLRGTRRLRRHLEISGLQIGHRMVVTIDRDHIDHHFPRGDAKHEKPRFAPGRPRRGGRRLRRWQGLCAVRQRTQEKAENQGDGTTQQAHARHCSRFAARRRSRRPWPGGRPPVCQRTPVLPRKTHRLGIVARYTHGRPRTSIFPSVEGVCWLR